PPRSPLFPYTTLFRSRRASTRPAADVQPADAVEPFGRRAGSCSAPLLRCRDTCGRKRSAVRTGSGVTAAARRPAPSPRGGKPTRSEEHTSELQSLAYL